MGGFSGGWDTVAVLNVVRVFTLILTLSYQGRGDK
jgi:hypothetical protein